MSSAVAPPQVPSCHRSARSRTASENIHCDKANTQVTIQCVEHTVAWLQSHDLEKAPSSFIQSLLHWFHDRPENDNTPPLPLDWGMDQLGLAWNEQSFGVLNGPLYADMKQARQLLRSGRLTNATISERAAFGLWFAEFLDQVSVCDQLKQRLLAEKVNLGQSATTHVITLYNRVQALYEESIKAANGDDDSEERVNRLHLQCLDELDAVLTDEELAVADVNKETSSPTLEHAALSVFCSHLRAEDAAGGVFVAKLVAWLRSTLSREDFAAFFKLLAPPLKEGLARHWKAYADHLNRLEPFSIDDEAYCCADYPRARVQVSPTNNQTAIF
ncbi:hypothetical protein AeMF1_013454 [Aphanomyces euteiches]|nr:hypothetical protein AeMF1_013454 [Aphanomyces euteiches]KAH9184567.1 hypothetical protein AeNC1_013459 [Aphanomyces euteiches]